jgi:hypothetical protein
MSKNPEFAKYAADIARSQDCIRSANEELIKLSQRLGRMLPRLQRLETSAILSWFNIYNKIKDGANRVGDELTTMNNVELVNLNPVLQSQVSYYLGQKSRFYAKVEVMDDILTGMMEDLLENGSFEESQKEEIRVALDGTMEKSRRKMEAMPALA